MVIDYLKGNKSASEFLEELDASGDEYNLFNLVLIEPRAGGSQQTNGQGTEPTPYCVHLYNNIEKQLHKLSGEFHGFGNSYPSKPFKKIEYGLGKFEQVIKSVGVDIDSHDRLLDSLLEMMTDETRW